MAPGGESTALWSLYRIDAVAAGCLLALVPLRIPSWAATMGWVALAAMIFIPDPPAWWSTGLTIACALIVAGARPGWLSSRLLLRLGQISYGLYLWQVIPTTLLKGEILTHNPIAIAVAVVISLAIALASEPWIERPWRRSHRPDPTDSKDRSVSIGRADLHLSTTAVDGSFEQVIVAR